MLGEAMRIYCARQISELFSELIKAKNDFLLKKNFI